MTNIPFSDAIMENPLNYFLFAQYLCLVSGLGLFEFELYFFCNFFISLALPVLDV